MAIVHKLQVPNSSGTNVTHTLGTVHYIVGTGTTAGTWLGTDSSITEYYDGLTIAYKLNVAGASTTTLNLNGLGAKTVYRGGTTKLTTQYGVNSVVLLVYTTTSSTGCWQVADYDSNTTYTGEKGITVSSGKIGHSNSVTAATAKGDNSKTLSFGGTFTVPSVTYDAQGHITAKGTTTMTMPANPNTDTKNTTGSTNTDSKIFLVGATSQAANPQTYSHDTAYVGTDGHLYSNSAKVLSTTYAPEGYLQWGGQSVAGGVTPIGMSLSEEHSGNKAAFIHPNAISVEYSTDGTTYTDAGLSNSDKVGLFTTSAGVNIGGNTAMTSSNYSKLKTRITLTAQDGTNQYIYTDVVKLLINMSTAVTTTVLIETMNGDSTSWVTYGTYNVSGWSGWNDIPLKITLGGSASQKNRPWKLRFTFSLGYYSTSSSTTKTIMGFRIFGQNSWYVPSILGKTGHLYSYDISQNATFPAGINTVGNLTENGVRVSNRNHTHSVSGTAASGGASTSTNTGSSGGGTANQSTGSTTPTFTGTSATTSSAGGGAANQTTGANSGTGVTVVTGVASNGTTTALTGVKASSTDTFVKTVSGGSGSLEAYDAATNGTKKVSNGTRIPFVTSISSTGASGTSTSGFLKSINGGSGSLTSNTTATNGITYVESVSHTAASLTGTKTFNTDAIKSIGGTRNYGFSSSTSDVMYSPTVTNGVLSWSVKSASTQDAHTGTAATTGTVGISGGSISSTTKYLHHTHTGASAGTTASAITSVSGGKTTATTHYLAHGHTAASAGSSGSAVTAVAANGTATVLTGVKASGTATVAPNEHTHTYTKPAAHTHTVTATGTVSGHTHTYVKPAAHTHSYNAPANHTHTVSGTAAKES